MMLSAKKLFGFPLFVQLVRYRQLQYLLRLAIRRCFKKAPTFGWNGMAPVGVIGLLDAHPVDMDFDGGLRGFLAPFNFNIALGPVRKFLSR